MRLRRTGWVCLALAGMVSLLSAGQVGAQPKGGALTRFISPDFCAALIIHPQRMGESPLAATIKESFPKDTKAADPTALLTMLGAQKGLPPGIDVTKLAKALEGKAIQRIVLLADPLPAPNVPVAPGLIVQFTADVDGAAIVAAIGNDWQVSEAQGTKYQAMKSPTEGQPPLAVCVVDGQTILLGFEPTVVKMLAKDQGSQPLVEQLRRTSLNNDMIVEFLVDPLLAKLAKSTGKSPEEALGALGDPGLAAMAKDVKSLSATINLSGATLFHAELMTTKEETAAGMQMMASMGVAGGKQKLDEFKKQPPTSIIPAPLAPMVAKLGDEIFTGLSVKNDGVKLVIDLSMPASLPAAIQAVGQLVTAMSQTK